MVRYLDESSEDEDDEEKEEDEPKGIELSSGSEISDYPGAFSDD